MSTERIIIDPKDYINFSEALRYLSETETIPFEKTPRLVASSVAALSNELQAKNSTLSFEEIAKDTIEKSHNYDTALLGQQITRTLEPIIYQGVKTNTLHSFKFESPAIGIGGYLVGLPNSPEVNQRFNVTRALAHNLWEFIGINAPENKRQLKRWVTTDTISEMLIDARQYDPRLHVYLDVVFGKFLQELRDFETDSPQCDIFRETRNSIVENKLSDYQLQYRVNSGLKTVQQQYDRFKYNGPVYPQIRINLEYPERQEMRLLSRLPILGFPLLRAVANSYRKEAIISPESFQIPDHILSPALVMQVHKLKEGEPSIFESRKFEWE